VYAKYPPARVRIGVLRMKTEFEKRIPKYINESLCPKCVGKIYSFKHGIWFCPECKGTWEKGVFRKSKLKLGEFLVKQLSEELSKEMMK